MRQCLATRHQRGGEEDRNVASWVTQAQLGGLALGWPVCVSEALCCPDPGTGLLFPATKVFIRCQNSILHRKHNYSQSR